MVAYTSNRQLAQLGQDSESLIHELQVAGVMKQVQEVIDYNEGDGDAAAAGDLSGKAGQKRKR